MADAILRLTGISKSFAGNRVLDDVTFEVQPGAVHALVGENGAGKSTLMNIIGGVLRPDEGHIGLSGQEVRFAAPLDAMRAGISIVHQELSLVPNLSVAQNIFCRREPVNRLGFIRWKRLHEQTRSLFERLGLDLDPETPAGRLSVGIQQTVEIAKALSFNARIIIMDEPTSALSEQEVTHLYRIIAALKNDGVAVVFISHKLDEVFRVADEISVLRDGRMIGTVQSAASDRQAIIRMMVGRPIEDLYPPHASQPGGEILNVEGLSRRGLFEDVSFGLRRGEILGWAGLVGAGRTETALALVGAIPRDSGRVTLEGRAVRLSSPRAAIRRGLCYLTEDRKQLGLFLTLSVRRNIVAASLTAFTSAFGWLRARLSRRAASDLVNRLQIRPPDLEAPALNLSGGNQQKVLLARWLCAQPRVLIVDEPTRGVDVAAKARIHADLRRLADEGVGIIVISSELPEVLGLSDRVAVFCEGRLRGMLPANCLPEEVMRLATP